MNDPVTVPWLEWHNTREELREAKRLLRYTLAKDEKGEAVDRWQISQFLERCAE